MPYRFAPPLLPGPSWKLVSPVFTLHLDCPRPGSGLRLSQQAEAGCCREPASLTHGDVVDDHLAAWLRGRGAGRVLEELVNVCRVCGETDCEQAARLRQEAAQADWTDRLRVAVEPNGQATTSAGQHVVAALIDAGRDWRQVATVNLPSYRDGVPYAQVWPNGDGPDPGLPSLPRTVDLPPMVYQLVREWVDQEMAAGRLVIAAQLPPPGVRRQLRETAGQSRPQVAELVGVSKEAVRLWELGALEPAGENRARYVDLLTQWQSGPQEPAEPPAENEPEPGPQVCNIGGWCSLHGRQHGLADQQAARAAAYAAHQERVQQANALALARRVTGR